MTEVSVLIVVRDKGDIDKVKKASERHGLRNVAALPRLGILRGLIEPQQMTALAKIPGVRSVEKEGEIKLPPPDSSVQ
jgi:hypothetical protein